MAIIIAARFAEDCELVITEASQAFVEDHTLDGIRAAKAQFQKPGQMDKLARYHGNKARWVLEAWTEVWLDPSFHHWNLEPFLQQVRCPVLALHGDHDEFGTLEFPRRIAEGFRGPPAKASSRTAAMFPIGSSSHMSWIPSRPSSQSIRVNNRELAPPSGVMPAQAGLVACSARFRTRSKSSSLNTPLTPEMAASSIPWARPSL